MSDKVEKTDEEWRAELTPEQYRVARGKGTVHSHEYDLSNWGLADLTANAVVA